MIRRAFSSEASGGLLAYEPRLSALDYRAATCVDKVLKGGKPAHELLEQPTKFEFVIHRKTAKALGLTIPQSLPRNEDEVIQ